MVEKDKQSKLELLFKKNFYDIAVKIAKSQQYDEDGLVDIFKQYGDHLYTKGDYSTAIDNYGRHDEDEGEVLFCSFIFSLYY